MIRRASPVFVVDKERDRLDLAGRIGATPVDFSRATRSSRSWTQPADGAPTAASRPSAPG
jgi:hypothetical protein